LLKDFDTSIIGNYIFASRLSASRQSEERPEPEAPSEGREGSAKRGAFFIHLILFMLFIVLNVLKRNPIEIIAKFGNFMICLPVQLI
jgi:hypothetical protein